MGSSRASFDLAQQEEAAVLRYVHNKTPRPPDTNTLLLLILHGVFYKIKRFILRLRIRCPQERKCAVPRHTGNLAHVVGTHDRLFGCHSRHGQRRRPWEDSSAVAANSAAPLALKVAHLHSLHLLLHHHHILLVGHLHLLHLCHLIGVIWIGRDGRVAGRHAHGEEWIEGVGRG